MKLSSVSARRLWRGAGPNAIRAMAVNAAMLATYDEVKQQLAASGVGTTSQCEKP